MSEEEPQTHNIEETVIENVDERPKTKIKREVSLRSRALMLHKKLVAKRDRNSDVIKNCRLDEIYAFCLFFGIKIWREIKCGVSLLPHEYSAISSIATELSQTIQREHVEVMEISEEEDTGASDYNTITKFSLKKLENIVKTKVNEQHTLFKFQKGHFAVYKQASGHADPLDTMKRVNSGELSIAQVQGARDYMEDTYCAVEFLNELVNVPLPGIQVGNVPKKQIVRRLAENMMPNLMKHTTAPELVPPKNYLWSFYAVYDGHGGEAAAKYAQVNLLVNIVKSTCFPNNVIGSLLDGFQKTNDEFNQRFPSFRCGTTAVIALFRDDTVFLANVGDSRALLGKVDGEGKKIAVDLGQIHTTADQKENARVIEKGGVILQWGGGLRVNGELVVTRSIGDPQIGPCMISEPEIVKIDIEKEHKFLVLASDGLFDVMKSQEIVDFIFAKKAETKANPNASVNNISDALIDTALQRESKDNISAIIVFFETDN